MVISKQMVFHVISVLKMLIKYIMTWSSTARIIVHFVLYAFIASAILTALVRADDATTELTTQTTTPGSHLPVQGGAHGDQNIEMDTTELTTKKRRTKTTPQRMTFEEDCDFLAYYCLRAYQTGELCGRTVYYRYATFVNYCMLDYVNCMERYEVWQVVHMGECFNITALTDYVRYEYADDFFLDQYYVIQD